MDTWRTWELVLPALERRHEVFAPTLPGHAGGPPLGGAADDVAFADAVERALDEAGIGLVDIAGNSLGGWLALRLAARGRARTVVAFAPAGGWDRGDPAFRDLLSLQASIVATAVQAAPHADTIAATPDGRRRATEHVTGRAEHLPPALVAHLIRGAAGCADALPMLERARTAGWELDAARIACPVRIVWGTADRLLAWPSAAARLRRDWLPHADWVELEGVGHCPQLEVPLEAAQLILGFTAP